MLDSFIATDGTLDCMRSGFEKFLLAVKAFSQVLFLYGFFAWIYGVVIQVAHPEWLPLQLSHLTPWIRVDTFTILSFIISAIGFFIWRVIAEVSKPEKERSST